MASYSRNTPDPRGPTRPRSALQPSPESAAVAAGALPSIPALIALSAELCSRSREIKAHWRNAQNVLVLRKLARAKGMKLPPMRARGAATAAHSVSEATAREERKP